MKKILMIIALILGFTFVSFAQQKTPVGFKCGQQITDTRDGHVYNTDSIGTQCWFKENLNIGTQIPFGTPQTNNSIIEKYCYKNDVANCNKYGGEYQWNEMMNYNTSEGSKGICPGGWHVATYDEWYVLINANGKDSLAGAALNEAGYAHWLNPNIMTPNYYGNKASWQHPTSWIATNSTGLSVLPNGIMGGWGGLGSKQGEFSRLWSSTHKKFSEVPQIIITTEDQTPYPTCFSSAYQNATFQVILSYETATASVRCVRDQAKK